MHKNKGLKINAGIKPHGAPALPGAGAPVLDRREQRKLDQAKGLVPFACKLNGELLKQLQSLAQERQVDMNELVGELLTAGLAAGEQKPKAAKSAAKKKVDKGEAAGDAA
jgi:hypothetical protein